MKSDESPLGSITSNKSPSTSQGVPDLRTGPSAKQTTRHSSMKQCLHLSYFGCTSNEP